MLKLVFKQPAASSTGSIEGATRAVDALAACRLAAPFRSPVVELFPNLTASYKMSIKTPIDLSTIRADIEAGKYAGDPQQLL